MTPKEYIDNIFSLRDHDDLTYAVFAPDVLRDAIISAISAAVAAEHQRTLRQCAEESSHVILNYFDLADTRRVKLSRMVKDAILALLYVTP